MTAVSQIFLAGVADIKSIGNVASAVVAAIDLVQVIGQVLLGDVGTVGNRFGGKARGGAFELAVVGNGNAAPEQLQAVQVDGEVAHVLLHERDAEQHRHEQGQTNEHLLQRTQTKQRLADAGHAALGHVHGNDGVDIDVLVLGQSLFQLFYADHAVAFGTRLFVPRPLARFFFLFAKQCHGP